MPDFRLRLAFTKRCRNSNSIAEQTGTGSKYDPPDYNHRMPETDQSQTRYGIVGESTNPSELYSVPDFHFRIESFRIKLQQRLSRLEASLSLLEMRRMAFRASVPVPQARLSKVPQTRTQRNSLSIRSVLETFWTPNAGYEGQQKDCQTKSRSRSLC